MINKVNKIWSDVLMYRPTIRKKDLEEEKSYSQIVEKRTALSDNFKNYTQINPCTSIKSLNNNISIINSNIQNFKEDIYKIDPIFLSSLENGDSQYVENIISENQKISGNGLYEGLLISLNDLNLLTSVKNSLIFNYYPNISDEKTIEEAHEKVTSRITEIELNQEYEKINYTSMALDSYISSIFPNFSEQLCNMNTDLYSSIAIKNEINIEGDKDNINYILEKQFNDICNIQKNVLENYKKQVDFLNNNNILSNVLEKRKELNCALSAYSSVNKNLSEDYIDLIIKIKEDAVSSSFEVADEYIKHLLNVLMVREECSQNLFAKEGLKNIYFKK